MSRPTTRSNDRSANLSTSVRSQRGFLSASPIAHESILRDLEDAEDDEENANGAGADQEQDAEGNGLAIPQQGDTEYSMVNSFRRTSYVAYGPRPLFPSAQPPEPTRGFVTQEDRKAALEEERSLLRDNQLIPPKHPRRSSHASGKSGSVLGKRLSVPNFVPRKKNATVDEEAVAEGDNVEPTETTALLGADTQRPYGGEDTPENINRKWGEAVAAGKIQTTWQREAKVLARYSRSLIVTFILQYSLTMASVFTVGHIGKLELGAVSWLKTLVGLQLQRMVYFLWLMTIPIAFLWGFGTQILEAIVPEKETAALSGQYLRILIIGAPGYAAFEGGKRFVQAQGQFQATLYVLLFCAPFNAFLHWLFVWRLEWGFIGAPIAVVTVETLMPICLFLYVRFVGGMECWSGFTRRAFKNWGPMIRLALPGLVMILAEYLAFEILTLSASFISSTHLATQSVLSTISTLTYQIPFPISIAASTRVANLVGATLTDAGKLSAKVAFVAALIVGILNMILLSSTRNFIPYLFTNDPDVAELTSKTLPLNAAFQLFDALAALCNGILRGLGRQEFGSYVNLFAYYVIAMPISFGTGFGLHWDLYGLWAGPALALGIVAGIEGWFIYRTSWEKAAEDAQKRNNQA
ncbi:hypothetical protein H2203_006169 [Taxawa tesnikishii (nom. ined.)]|nr:hypothetical protein H2203_006169 [Dothideales sp. JES 119]